MFRRRSRCGLGARPRAGGILAFHLWRDNGRQRGLGKTVRDGGAADRLFRRGSGCGSRQDAGEKSNQGSARQKVGEKSELENAGQHEKTGGQ
jgi:hypothetical protein